MDREKILILTCCAPDLTYPLELLTKDYEVYVFFYNPNIHPIREYYRRLIDAILVTEIYDAVWVDAPYDYREWFKYIKGYEKEPEGGKRCELCFRMRLERACEKAEEMGIGKITTTLTISPHKDASLIKRLGEEVCEGRDVEYVHYDFKKKDGFKRSVELSKKFGLYRQKFCGCVFSLREAKERIKKRGKKYSIW